MKRKVYVASSWRNEYQQEVVKSLRNAGHEVYDFKHPAEGNEGFRWSEIDPNWQNWNTQQYAEALKHEYAQFGFDMDFNAMKASDACVLVLPCGRSANAEAGWMSGAGKNVFVYIPPACMIEPELMYKMFDGITSDIRDIHVMLNSSAPGISRNWRKEMLFKYFQAYQTPGNMAKIRASLKDMIRVMQSIARYQTRLPKEICMDACLSLYYAHQALDAPARNCDKYICENLNRDLADAWRCADEALMLDYDREDLPMRWLLSTPEQVAEYKKDPAKDDREFREELTKNPKAKGTN